MACSTGSRHLCRAWDRAPSPSSQPSSLVPARSPRLRPPSMDLSIGAARADTFPSILSHPTCLYVPAQHGAEHESVREPVDQQCAEWGQPFEHPSWLITLLPTIDDRRRAVLLTRWRIIVHDAMP